MLPTVPIEPPSAGPDRALDPLPIDFGADDEGDDVDVDVDEVADVAVDAHPATTATRAVAAAAMIQRRLARRCGRFPLVSSIMSSLST
jgi:hypothetical protein